MYFKLFALKRLYVTEFYERCKPLFLLSMFFFVLSRVDSILKNAVAKQMDSNANLFEFLAHEDCNISIIVET